MKTFAFFLLFLGTHTLLLAQITKETVNAKIDKAMNFYESKKDSLKILAEQIRDDAAKLSLKREGTYYHRFMGFYYEYDGKMEQAAQSYLTFLKEAEAGGFITEKYQAIGDMAILYINLEQKDKAKVMLKKGVTEGPKEKASPRSISAYYTNLGVIYRQNNQYDSALYCYQKALQLKKQVKDSVGVANVNINIATMLNKQKKFAQAKPYVEENLRFHQKNNLKEDLWFDYGNLATIYLGLGDKVNAEKYAFGNLQIAKALDSKPKIHKSLEGLSDLYRELGDYKKAYQYFVKYDSLGKVLLNLETNESVANLQEKYESEKKAQENRLLNQRLEQEQQQKLAYGIGLLGLLAFSGVIGYFLYKNRQKNRLIEHQNEKLSALNRDKNYILSMVSHDLNTPFLTIKTWNNLLKMSVSNNPKATEAAQVIEKSAEQGIALIKNILDIERTEINQQNLNLTRLDLVATTQGVVKEFEAAAAEKNITVRVEASTPTINVLSDQHLMERVLENLLSNALKYSHAGQQVWVQLSDFEGRVELSVKDEGVGIAPEDLPKLFQKYGTTASRPTAGEASEGLGLNIVKRILDEIGGKITCQSQPNQGSTFTVILYK
jgi:signal transduction histidine kinase